MMINWFRHCGILALAACFSVCGVNAALAAKDVFIRTKPHVNVGTIGGEPAVMWFRANAGVLENGNASGTIQIRVVGGEHFLYRVVQGKATVERRTVVELVLTLQRVGEDRSPTGETDLAIVHFSSAIEDRLIYDVVGAQVHVETQGTLGFRHEHTRPESLP